MRTILLTLSLLLLPLAGCLEQAPAGDIAPAEAAADAAAPKRLLQATFEGESHFLAKHRTPLGYGNFNGMPAQFGLERAGARNATLVATWTPTSQLSEELDIAFYTGGGDAITVLGTSPVVIEIPGEFLTEEREFYAEADPADPGAAYDQRVSYTLTVLYEE